jgi:hypothetical protein
MGLFGKAASPLNRNLTKGLVTTAWIIRLVVGVVSMRPTAITTCHLTWLALQCILAPCPTRRRYAFRV